MTGASSGIGRYIPIECSKMGASLVITGRNKERLNETFNSLQGVNNISIAADLTSEEDIQNLVELSPGLDGVVHSAGVMNRVLLKMVRTKDIQKTMSANFTAPVLLKRALL